MIDEAFLPLDIQTATAVIERLSLAQEAMWGETRQIPDGWKTAGIYRQLADRTAVNFL